MKLNNNKLTLAICLALSLSACSPKMTVEQYLAQAKTFSEQRDHDGAIIALKNAVRLEPKNPIVRFDLGAMYLAQGNYSSAEKELEKAEKLGSDNALLMTKLVQVKVKLEKFDYIYQLIELVDTYEDADKVMLLTYAGIAAIHQNKAQLAKEYIEDAISISDDSIYGQIGQAYISHSGNNYQEGLATVNELLITSPDFAEAILLKGYLLQASEQFDEAAKTFEKYSKIRPKDIQIKFFVAQNYVFSRQFDKAEPYVDLLLKISEAHPLANQLKAEIEYSKQNFKLAKEYAEVSLLQDESFYLSRIIAGVSTYKLGDFEQSYYYLNAIKNRLPPEHLIRKLIIDLQLKLGYETEAVSELQSLAELDGVDSVTLTAFSNKMLALGNTEVAEELLDASIALNTSDPSELAKQGVTQLRLNQADKGIAILEEALKLDPDLVMAEQGLAVGYLSNNQLLEAYEIAKKWQNSKDKQIQGYLLESAILDKQDKSSESQIILQKILTLDSQNVPALYKLAVYSHKAKDTEQAYNYYTQVLTLESGHMRSMINLAQLTSSTVKLNNHYLHKSIAFYTDALKEVPDDNYKKLGLAYIYRAVQNIEQSITLLKEIAKSEKPLKGIDMALANSYVAMGRWEEAVKIYGKLTDENPNNLKAVLKTVTLYEQYNQVDNALALLEKTLEDHQDNIGLLLLKSYYHSLLMNEPSQSDLDKIKDNDETKDHWLLDKTLGNFAYNDKNFDSSAKYYSSAYKKQPNEINVINWSKSVALSGDKHEALVILEQYLSNLKEDTISVSLQIMLGGAYLGSDRLSEAASMYEGALLQEPNNLIALNNLSYLALQKNNIKESIDYAKRAVKLAENNAVIIDTYAQALVANKQFSLAIEQYDRALKISDNNAEIAKHKAKALELKADMK